jgi:hypothetical protein
MSLSQKQKDLIEALKAGNTDKVGQLHDQGAEIMPIVRAVKEIGEDCALLMPLATYLNVRFGNALDMTSEDTGLTILQKGWLKSSVGEVAYNHLEIKEFLDISDVKPRYYKWSDIEITPELKKVHKHVLEYVLERAKKRAKHASKNFTLASAVPDALDREKADTAEARQLITKQPATGLKKLVRRIGIRSR